MSSKAEWNFNFTLGDRLPTIYDAAIQMYQVSPYLKSAKSKYAIVAYADAVLSMWHRSFKTEFTLGKTAVINKLENIMKDYVKKVTGRERYGDSQRGVAPKLICHLNREWRMALAFVGKQAGRINFQNCGAD